MGIALVLGLAACSAKPFEYQDQTEIPAGEGLFTGKEGAITASDEADTERTAVPADCACPEGAELEAYRDFLRWKANAIGTPEYQQFQDWRVWRREQSEGQ